MKLALITHFPADPNTPRGGVEAVSVNLCRGLSLFKDLDVHAITVDRNLSSIDQSTVDGFTLHRLPYLGGSTLTNAIGRGRLQIHDYLRQLAPDIVHAHDTYGLMVEGLNIPRVFTIHGFIYGDTLVSQKKFAWLRAKLWKHFETRAWADQPHIISISPYVRERLTGITRAHIHDIDNPISKWLFDVRSSRRAGDTGVIFSAAVIEPRKNTLALVEACGQLIKQGLPLELRLAGPITDAVYGARVREMIRQLRVESRVHLLGSISSSQVHQELSRASVFALVSLEENSPMGIEEAMAAGVPVITSNRCGMPYMVRHGESGFLVDPFSTADIAYRLKILLDDEALRVEMGSNARQTALQRFHPDAVCRRTREVYYDVMGTRAPAVQARQHAEPGSTLIEAHS